MIHMLILHTEKKAENCRAGASNEGQCGQDTYLLTLFHPDFGDLAQEI